MRFVFALLGSMLLLPLLTAERAAAQGPPP